MLEKQPNARGLYVKAEGRLSPEMRDRAGIKPLYYHWDGTHLVFSSEIKAILEHPICYASAQQSWVIYSYNYAKEILLHEDAFIPKQNTNLTDLNTNSISLIQKLTRLTNARQHELSRQAALFIYNNMQSVPINEMIEPLLTKGTLDWVDAVCKKLPLLYILKSLGFSQEDCTVVLAHIAELVKIMSPQKTTKEITQLNNVVDIFFSLSQKYLTNNSSSETTSAHPEWTELLTCNLIGLLIQSYEAGRGLLTNTMIQLLNADQPHQEESHFKQAVIETLRFDPPVHLTKRIAGKDILIGNQMIKEGEMITIVLAAANLDPQIFESPLSYNPSRSNNHAHLTFGAGHHQCLAKHLTEHLAVETFKYLFHQHNPVQIPKQLLEYEPPLNVRLVKNLFITI